MADLHARLLAEIDRWQIPETHYNALRAVVELHEPVKTGSFPGYFVCHGCDQGSYAFDSPDWPCETVRSIAEQLGVPMEDKSITEKESPTNG